jgi:hypothetical protein
MLASRSLAAVATALLAASPLVAQQDLGLSVDNTSFSCAAPLASFNPVGSVGCRRFSVSPDINGSLIFTPDANIADAPLADGSTFVLGSFLLSGYGSTGGNMVNFSGATFNLTVGLSGAPSFLTLNPVSFAGTDVGSGTLNSQGNTSVGGIQFSFGSPQAVSFTNAQGSGSFLIGLNDVALVKTGRNATASADLTATVSGYTFTANPPVTATPEPATVSLMAGGVLALGAFARRRRRTV